LSFRSSYKTERFIKYRFIPIILEVINMPTDYKAEFRKLDLRDVESDHIQPTPRWDLQKVYVFTKDIPTDQLRTDLEERVGIRPDISTAYAIQSMLYVLPTDMPEGMPAEIRDAVAGDGLDTNAVFIRGATNPFCAGGAKERAGKLLHDALQELQGKYDGRVGWRFGEAKDLLDTSAVLVAHDQDLAKMEYLS
jgi:hypothetical protein